TYSNLPDAHLPSHAPSTQQPPNPPRSPPRPPTDTPALAFLSQERRPNHRDRPFGPRRDLGFLNGSDISRGSRDRPSEVDGPPPGRRRDLNYCALRGHLRIRIRVARLSARVCTDADGGTDEAERRAD